MLETNETAFLQAIAAEPDDTPARLVFADWLDERGDNPRADFIRVQCELASAELPAERRQALRVRERELLNEHRQVWCQGFGLPIEDVAFERGLIAKMRLSQWDGGKLLDPAHAPRFATLTELDLSGLQLGDDGLILFAKKADFPALRKLIVSDNSITNAGALALASAKGLPRLDTLYLFRNSISDDARAVLEGAEHFQQTNLDMGEREDGYCLSPGEAEMARREYLRKHLLPVVSQYFATYERLQSAMLYVAQYWCDEANDAVHGTLIVSELFEPTLEGASSGYEESKSDANLPNTRIQHKYFEGSSSVVDVPCWDVNTGAIPLWAAFAPEEGSQDDHLGEAYLPAVLFYRHGGYEILPMCRPHLDGVRPEWGWEE